MILIFCTFQDALINLKIHPDSTFFFLLSNIPTQSIHILSTVQSTNDVKLGRVKIRVYQITQNQIHEKKLSI